MDFIANRVKEISPYLFADFQKKKQALIADGADVIDLGIGAPDGPAPDFIVDTLSKEAGKTENHRYSPFQGGARFRQAVAHFYKKTYDVTLDPDSEILTLIGSKEGIANLMQTLVNPGEEVLVPNPGYPAYKTAVHLADGILKDLPLDPTQGFKPNWDNVKNTDNTKLMLLNYPNNPTGATISKADFAEAVDFAKKEQIIIAHDSAYSLVQFGNYQSPSIMQIEGAKDIAVEFGSLSKNFNMSGWRIGYVVGKKEVIQALATLKSNVDTSQFLAVQNAAATALESDLSFTRENSRVFEERMEMMYEAITRLGLKAEKPNGTIFLWAQVPDNYTSAEFATLLLNEAHMIVTPGHLFGSVGEGYIRISLTVDVERLKTVISRLEKVLKK